MGASGRPTADTNGDYLVTDQEPTDYVTRRVSGPVRSIKRLSQTPVFYRFDEDQAARRQFLFVPS